jgi:hypothetical protein
LFLQTKQIKLGAIIDCFYQMIRKLAYLRVEQYCTFEKHHPNGNVHTIEKLCQLIKIWYAMWVFKTRNESQF